MIDSTLKRTMLSKHAESLYDCAFKLAMLTLQSDAYKEPDIREEVDNILAIWKSVEGRP